MPTPRPDRPHCRRPGQPARIAIIALLVTVCGFAHAGDDAAAPTFAPVTDALLLGPVTTPWPAFHDAAARGYGLDDQLAGPLLAPARLRPRDGDGVALPGEDPARWRHATASDGGYALPTDGSAPAEVYLACYVTADRFQKAAVRLSGDNLKAYLDGEPITLEPAPDRDKESDDQSAAPATTVGELTLPPGSHTLIVRTVRAPEVDGPWRIAVEIARPDSLPATALTTGVDPSRTVQIETVLDAPRFAGAAVSPDGELVAVTLGAYDRNGERETWLEIRAVEDGLLQQSWRGGLDIGQVQWAPTGHRLGYTSVREGKTTLWSYDLDSGEATAVVYDVEKFQEYRWAPDGNSVVYAVSVEAAKDDRKVKQVRHPADRQPWWRNRSYLVQTALPDGVTRRLTAGPLSPNSWRLAPDGRKLLFFLEEPDLSERPYSTSELWELDLATLRAEMILADRWIGGAEYGPEPGRLLLQGSPSAFDGAGRTLPDTVQVNDYGGQLYLYDRATGDATPLTKTFAPDVAAAWWSAADGRIYALCTDTQYRNVYVYDRGKGTWRQIETGVAFTRHFAPAQSATIAVAYGSGATEPNRLYAIDLERNQAWLLHDPGEEAYRDVVFGESKRWSCRLPDGQELDGRIYFPPDFDPRRTYPVIVYYYGGTSPVTVDFGGRYPKNIWAGHGYLVYVPEPSGATGYGQEFAARHVNDWGRRTAWEVIEGTRAFLAAHTYADAEHVGCIGASYGGFLTEYIITQTDQYAAAVSHAGISSIASYWGEGLWGYVYGARALADAFPWQDRELYIEQSPLFHADKITTPLLLLHGDSDTNVPVGESDQLFTALQLLGRDVTYVQIIGQDHHILDHGQRIVWNDTILAYFARYLKEQPEWWDHLYPAGD